MKRFIGFVLPPIALLSIAFSLPLAIHHILNSWWTKEDSATIVIQTNRDSYVTKFGFDDHYNEIGNLDLLNHLEDNSTDNCFPTVKLRQNSMFNLEKSVGSRKASQSIDAPGKPEKPLITSKVTTSFSDSPFTPMAYTSFSRPTDFSRFN